jgi:hypothetical protein
VKPFWLFAVALAAAPLVLSLPAEAQDSPIGERATALFNEAKELEANGELERARARFAESAELVPQVGALARLAGCEEKLGRILDARQHWAAARDLAQELGDPRADHAAQEYARVDATVPRVRLTLESPAPPGLVVSIDDAPATLEAAVPVAAGEHAIVATAPGKRLFSVSVRVQADGAVITIPLELVDLAPAGQGLERSGLPLSAPLPLAPETLSRDQAARTAPVGRPYWTTRRKLAVVTAGVGVIALSTGSYFGLQAFAKWSDAKSECGVGCRYGDPAWSTRSEAQTSATVATVAFGLGAAALTAAAISWFTAPREPSRASNTQGVYVVPLGGPAGAGATIVGRLDL